MRYLCEQDIGFPTTVARVPIVPAAVIFDLPVGRPNVFPGDDAGYRAVQRSKSGKIEQGTVGAGTGATVAKLLGIERAVKGGVGTASVAGPRGLVVGALVVSNGVGAVIDPETARLVAGPRDDDGSFVAGPEVMRRASADEPTPRRRSSVATNANLQHHQVRRMAIEPRRARPRCCPRPHLRGWRCSVRDRDGRRRD
jgi:L-aminopeptidase/D-esterase-like protein